MGVAHEQVTLSGDGLEVRHAGEAPTGHAPHEVRHTLRVNGRPAPRGRSAAGRVPAARWQVRLGLAWDADTWEHAWLSVLCEPPRPGVASGVWLLPLGLLEQSLDETVTAGTVHLAPDGEDRMWLEVTASVGTAARPWAVSLPRRWVCGFLADVAAASRPPGGRQPTG